MAEAIKIEQFNIHTYLIFLHLLPIAIKLLCRQILRSTRDKKIQRWKENLVKEQRLDAYLRGPRPGRRHRPPPHRCSRPPQINPRRNSRRGVRPNSGQTVAGVLPDPELVLNRPQVPRGTSGIAVTPWWKPSLFRVTPDVLGATTHDMVWSCRRTGPKPGRDARQKVTNSAAPTKKINRQPTTPLHTMDTLLRLHPCAFRCTASNQRSGATRCRFDTDSFKIGVDNHASRCMSNNLAHFVDFRPTHGNGAMVGGIQGGLSIRGEGTLVFNVEDDDGRVHTIRIPHSLYLPELPMCLLSPQHWAQEADDNVPIPRGTRMENFADGCRLIWNQLDFSKTIPFNATTNTPVFHTAPSACTYCAFVASAADIDRAYQSVPIENHSAHFQVPRRITPPTPDEFIADENIHTHGNGGGNNTHVRTTRTHISSLDVTPLSTTAPEDTPPHGTSTSTPTSDLPIRRAGALTFDPSQDSNEREEDVDLSAMTPQAELMRWHYRLGHLPFAKLKILAKLGEIPKRLAKVFPPKCAGCIFGAMTKMPWRSRATKPGECVSVDQMISTHVGFIAQLKGKLTRDRYKAATIFVDHYSRLRFVHLMRNLSSEETINAKLAFEQYARDHGVTILHYHADNGRFADNAFKASCERERQRLTFCGVNAHFQNGIAERAIRDLQDMTRKQLLHANSRWQAAVHLALWPYALRQAMVLHNTLPVLDDGTSRLEMFSGIRVGVRMRSMHTFGCPVFALRNELAGGNTIPKWSPRARMGLNLGPSMQHARNVSLVLNLATGLVSPQYHCNFDDFFETTSASQTGGDTLVSLWQRLAGFIDMSGVPPTSSTMTTTHIDQKDFAATNEREYHQNHHVEYGPGVDQYDLTPGDSNEYRNNEFLRTERDPIQPNPTSGTTRPTTAPDVITNDSGGQTIESGQAPSNTPNDSQPTSVSSRGRLRRVTQAMKDSIAQRTFYGKRDMHYMAAQAATTEEEDDDEYTPDFRHDEHLNLQEAMSHPIAFSAQMTGDIMYLHQALQQPDASEFVQAVIKEINGHVSNNNWRIIPRSEVPAGATIVPSVWALRRKRDLTTNEITKYKARLNLHGGKQEYGVNYFDTYAPVITWFAVRLMLMFAIVNGWAMRQVDFVMAYPQAPIEMDMYMDLPPGIHTTLGDSKDYCLLLLNNLYGQKQAGRVWNQYLVDKLLSIGFTQSLVDECVFYRGEVIFIVYVDDGIFMGKNDQLINAAIEELKALDLNLEDQGHPADYVGVNIKQHKDGAYELTQRALIDSIIADAGLTDAKVKAVPAKVSVQLHAFKKEAPFSLNFNYRSIVGKLNYLAQTTRPDIMYATHQIAKYSADPREPHGEAILYLVRYLKKTRDIGIKFKPDPAKGFDCYCDADFSGNWNQDLAHNDPSTAKSRSGWIVYYAGCPIIWASKLQSQVALSTTEAEYIAMSMALRDVLPIMNLVKEMKDHGFPVLCTEPYVYCKVFEDNSGALELARLPKLRPRTKHINIVYHHFREAVRNGDIKIFQVDTGDQIADVLTKALAQNLFVRHRLSMCGK